MLEVYQIPALTDNYAFVLHEPVAQKTAVIDSPDAKVIIDFLDQHNFHLDYIFNTHHHFDHVGGNIELKNKYQCKILGSEYDAQRIPGLDQSFKDKDVFPFGKTQAHILFVPGHTLGMINYYFPFENLLFTGDCLFSIGCGRLFEGTPAMMWQSLQKLRQLPDNTKTYFAHEYTEKNIRFALTLQPHNQSLLTYQQKVQQLRIQNKSTVPTTIGLERKLNPFLRVDKDEFIGLKRPFSPLEAFTYIRKKRSAFF